MSNLFLIDAKKDQGKIELPKHKGAFTLQDSPGVDFAEDSELAAEADKIPQLPAFEQRPYSEEKEKENLTQMVQGQKATDIEERLYRAALQRKDIDSIQFQVSLFGGRRIPGGIVLDFLFKSGGVNFPVFVDGERYHIYRTEVDEVQEIRVNDFFASYASRRVQRVPGKLIEDMNEARLAIKKIIAGEYEAERAVGS